MVRIVQREMRCTSIRSRRHGGHDGQVVGMIDGPTAKYS
jgi:hypothetical protein